MAAEPTPTTDEAPAPAPEPPPPVAPADRAKNLYYVGEVDPVSGEPVQYLLGVPATDLDEAQIQLLSAEEYAACLSTGIYSDSKPRAKKGA